MMEPSIVQLLLYHLRHGHIHPSVVMQCVAQVQSEKGESSDMESTLGPNSVTPFDSLSNNQGMLLPSLSQEVVQSDTTPMEEIIRHPVPIYPPYERISFCSDFPNI
jgi:hypothetical protein